MRVFFGLIGAVTAAGFVAATPGAHAGPTASQILSTFNLVTTGNVTTNSDIEGSAVIGGNLQGSTFFNNDVPASPSIYLYGTENGGLNLDSGGSLYSSGTVNGKINYNGNGHLFTSGPPLPLSAYTSPLTQLSSTLNGLSKTAGDSITTGSSMLTFNANASGINVFNVSASTLLADMANNSITFKIGAAATSVIINVDGSGSFTEPGGTNWNGSPLEDVLFNFVGFSSVTVGNWESSILAPGAEVFDDGGAINGSLFAASFGGGGELHNDPFDGALPAGTIVPAPEPMSALLLGPAAAVICLIGQSLRRRRTVEIRAMKA